MKRVSIVGSGWLGQATASNLLENRHEVLASFTNNSIKLRLYELAIPSLHVDTRINKIPQEIFFNDVMCIFIPPSKSEDYIADLKRLVDNVAMKNIRHIIFTSSTSIYKHSNEAKKESSPLDKDSLLYEAEKLFNSFKNVTILRLAGLMGGSRYLSKYYLETVPKALTKVNHVHRSDVVQIITAIIEKELTGVFNICAPLHPSRQEVIQNQCMELMIPEPHYEQGDSKKGVILSDKIQNKLPYLYMHPDPSRFPLIKNQALF